MKHILHLVRFDAAALKWPLLGWTALLAAEAAWFYVGPSSVGRGGTSASSLLASVPIFIRGILTALLVVQLVQKDPMVGTTAFWQARPLSRGALLASKVISAVLWFVGLPAAITIGVLLLLGLALRDAAHAGWMVSQVQISIVVASMAAAAVTTSLLYFTLAMLGGIAAWGSIGSGIGSMLAKARPALRYAVGPNDRSVVIPLVIAALFITTVVSYLTLSVKRTWMVLGFVVLAGSLAAAFQVRTGPPSPQVLTADQEAAGGVSGLALTADVNSQYIEPASGDGRARLPRLTFAYSWSGVASDIDVRPYYIDTEVDFADGTRTGWSSTSVYAQARDRDRSPGTDGRATGIPFLSSTPHLMMAEDAAAFVFAKRMAVAEMSELDLRRHQGETVKLRCWVKCMVLRIRVAGSILLKEGNRLVVDRGVAVIRGIRRDSKVLAIDVRTTIVNDPTAVLDRNDMPAFRFSVLWNRSREQSVALSPHAHTGPSAMLFGPRGAISSRYAEEFVQGDAVKQKFPIDADWLADAEFVQVDARPLGLIQREIKIDSFVLGEKAK